MKKSVLSEKNQDKLGKFVKGNNANPTGKNGFTAAKQLTEAIVRQGKRRGEDFWDMAASRAYTNDQVLIAILKKFIPDKQALEHTLPEQLLEKFKGTENADLVKRARELALGIVGSSGRN